MSVYFKISEIITTIDLDKISEKILSSFKNKLLENLHRHSVKDVEMSVMLINTLTTFILVKCDAITLFWIATLIHEYKLEFLFRESSKALISQ